MEWDEKMRVVKKIFRWVFDIILFVILGIALIMAYNHIQINIKGNTYSCYGKNTT